MKNSVITKTKRDIAKAVSDELGIDMLEATKVTESVVSAMKNFLGRGCNLSVRTFANFNHKVRAEKVARNISAGTELILPPKNVIKVKISPVLAKEVEKLNKQ